MKVTIVYSPSEEREARLLKRVADSLLGGGPHIVTKVIAPKTGIVVRLVQDAEDLETCLKEIQDSDIPLVVQLGEGDRALLVTPC